MQLLKRYVAYAKAHCHPTLTLKAARVLQKLYLTMRNEARDGRSMPITMRQLESLVRLSQVLLYVFWCFQFVGPDAVACCTRLACLALSLIESLSSACKCLGCAVRREEGHV